MTTKQELEKYEQEVRDFNDHMWETAHEMLSKNDYDEKYDIVITVNGKSIRVPLHADSHSKVIELLHDELE